MKYICSVCGYIYDESKQKTPFDQLPASWVLSSLRRGQISIFPAGKERGSGIFPRPAFGNR